MLKRLFILLIISNFSLPANLKAACKPNATTHDSDETDDEERYSLRKILRSSNLSAFAGPAIVFDAGGALTGSAGLRYHLDVHESFFLQFQTQTFLKYSSSGSELLFSTDPFTPAKSVRYDQSTQYALAGLHAGYYFYGWAGESSNAYILLGANFMQARHKVQVEDFPRNQYEPFIESSEKTLPLTAWSLAVGHQSLLSARIGIFEEAQLNIGLNGKRQNEPFKYYQTPQGHFLALNFGFRFFLYPQDTDL